MTENTRRADSFAELSAFFDEFDRYKGWIFRGQANSRWPLLPVLARVSGVGDFYETLRLAKAHSQELRENFQAVLVANAIPSAALALPPIAKVADEIEQVSETYKTLRQAVIELFQTVEETSLHRWREMAARHLSWQPATDWQWLAIGQHHGLATRFLDWTRNPLAAAFFALSDARRPSAAIYAMRQPPRLDESLELNELTATACYTPPQHLDRIHRQSSLFTVSPPPFDSDEPNSVTNLVKLEIPFDSVEPILRKIISFGVDNSTLFPDLGGCASHATWEISNSALLASGLTQHHQELLDMRARLEQAFQTAHERFRKLLSGDSEPVA